ncbi:MAG: DUF5074 domain-containing protein [Balneolales bacterium]
MHPLQNKYACFILFFLITVFSACSDDPVSDRQENEMASLLVANEGNWSDGNGSITSYVPESGHVVQTLFANNNDRPFAGIIQTLVLYEEKLFIVANNTNKIEVTDVLTMQSIATISFDTATPAGFAPAGANKGYASSFYDNSVMVIDLESHTLTGTRIDVGMSPRGMLVSGNRLFVANSGENTVSIINTDTDEVTSTVTVGAAPSELIQDNEGRVWVVCRGRKAYDENWDPDPVNDIEGGLTVLDGVSGERLQTVETGGFPNSLAIDGVGGRAWAVNENTVQQIDMNTYQVVDEQFINRSFNGIGYSSAENLLYLAHNKGYTQSGQALLYTLNGAAVDSFDTGIAPTDFIFMLE